MKRILAFEGDQSFASELQAYLWRRGCVLRAIADAEEGLRSALNERPDLILLSIELPTTNGFSVCSRLKRNKNLKIIPLIILSSECSEETFLSHQKMESRAEGYFHKPVELELLFERVRELLDLSVAEPEQGATGRTGLITDDDEDSSTGSAPITAIFNSIDGAFEDIQDPVSKEGDRKTTLSSGPRNDLDLSSSAVSEGGVAKRGQIGREQYLIGLWSPDSRVRGQCFGFPSSRATTSGSIARLSAGRDTQNTIVVDDAGVSDDHFLLERNADGVFIRDLGSGNGTYVNDELLANQKLHGGEVIRFGETALLFLQHLDLDSQLEAVVTELSEVDQPTRALTRRALRERLEVEFLLATQESTPLSVAVISIDELRRIAYRYGEHVADRVIHETAVLLRSQNTEVVVGRDLCDDFLVVMPDTTERVAVAHAEGWRFEASVSEVLTESHVVKFTVSVGVIELHDKWTVTDLLRRAYRLVWEAQLAGGNRVAARGAHHSAV